jgi:hypothetical protein
MTRWTSPEAAELARSAGVGDAEDAMRRFARTLLDECGDRSIPVRLSTLFAWGGIRKVRSENMSLEGALRRLPDGRFDLLVREDAAPTRQRFSVAHELGHVLFYRHAPRAKASQLSRGARAPEEEERLCNIAAEELLMPRVVVERVCAATCGAARVLQLAQECDVSIEASMIRLAPLWDARGELQLWQHRNGWKPTLVRRLAGTRGSLSTFDVDEWNGRKLPEGAVFPWTATTSLYSRQERQRLFARTTVVSIGRHAPTLLVSHELLQEPTRKHVGGLEHVARERIRRAEGTRPKSDCPTCAGTGWVRHDVEKYDPADRLRPVRICPCRYDQRMPLSA